MSFTCEGGCFDLYFMLFVTVVKCLRHCGRNVLEVVPVLLEKLFVHRQAEAR